MRPKLTPLAAELACVAALGVASAAMLSGLAGSLDLALWDEASYLRAGQAIATRGLPPAEWGPLHALAYAALGKLTASPIEAFDLGYRALVLLPALAIYFAARRLRLSPALALLGSVGFLLSGAHEISPRPSLLALLCLLLGLTASTFARSRDGRLGVLAASLLVGSFARPELFVGFLAVGALALVTAVRVPRDERGPSLRRAALLVSSSLLLITVLGNPFGDTTHRRMYAFCQHFAVGYVARTSMPIEPWGECDRAIEAAFGPDVKSVPEAARRNPREFAAHVEGNLALFPREAVGLFTRHVEQALSERPWEWKERRAEVLLAAVLFLAALVLAWWRQVRCALEEPGLALAAIAAVACAGPSLLSAVLLYPREHYLVIPGVLLGLATLGLVARAARVHHPFRLSERFGNAAGLATAAAVVVLAQGLPRPEASPLRERRIVEALASVDLSRPRIGVLENDGGYASYLGLRYVRVSPAQRREGETLAQFFDRAGVELVVLDEALGGHRAFSQDPEFAAFARGPESFGFAVVKVPETDAAIAVRTPEAGAAPSVTRSLPHAAPDPRG